MLAREAALHLSASVRQFGKCSLELQASCLFVTLCSWPATHLNLLAALLAPPQSPPARAHPCAVQPPPPAVCERRVQLLHCEQSYHRAGNASSAALNKAI